MIDRPKQWLSAVPWESIALTNKTLCQTQQLEPLSNNEGFQKAQALWKEVEGTSMPLVHALHLCRQAQDFGPFTFNNANTFATVGRTLVEGILQLVPPVEAQMLRTTVSHYIAGQINRRELTQVLQHLEPLLANANRSNPEPAPASVPLPMPQQSRA